MEGIEVAEKIDDLKTNEKNRPMEDVRMYITLEEMSKEKITEKYGYQYPEPAE